MLANNFVQLNTIEIPNDWIPGRNAFVKLRISRKQAYLFAHMLSCAEIAASVLIWLIQKKSGFQPISYQDLGQIESAEIIITSLAGETEFATKLTAGIKVLMELGWVKNDEDNELIIVEQEILQHSVINKFTTYAPPCA